MEEGVTMTNIISIVLYIYLCINLVLIMANLIFYGNLTACKTLGNIMFPGLWVAHFIIFAFSCEIKDIKLPKFRRSYCKCTTCGVNHKTYSSKVNQLVRK